MSVLESVGVLVGGLALFLYGLDRMTVALKAIAGARLQTGLRKLTATRFRGVIAGAGVTALLNSSTITTVLMVGFVSAGIMTLDQSVPMIMGANIGSTFTAQLVAFNLKALVPFMLAIGFLLHSISKNEIFREAGIALFGLGLLLLGIEFMGDATRPLRTYQPFISLMQEMRHPLIGVAIGAVFTAIVQSSAATLAVTIALGSQGLIPIEAGIAIVLGANVGTCGTALLASIGKNAEAVQVGLVHLMFNVLGVLFFVFCIPQYAHLVTYLSPSSPELEGAARLAAETPRQIANAHTIFSVASTLILIWFATPMARLARRLAPSKPRSEESSLAAPRYLDDATFDVPAFAIGRVQLELMRMGGLIIDLVRHTARLAVHGDHQAVHPLGDEANSIDSLTAAIFRFIGRISEIDHSESEAHQLVSLTQITGALDGIHEVAVVNLSSIAERRLVHGVHLAGLPSANAIPFERSVVDHLKQAIDLIGTPDQAQSAQVVGAKPAIETLAAATRQEIMDKMSFSSTEDIQKFRLANELIEHFSEIARLTRTIARSTVDLAPAWSSPDNSATQSHTD
jgi:phosphate:Na+ symporter